MYFSHLELPRICENGDCENGTRAMSFYGGDLNGNVKQVNPGTLYPCQYDPNQQCLPRTSAHEYMKVSINDNPTVTKITPNTIKAGETIEIHIGVAGRIPVGCDAKKIFKYTITPQYNGQNKLPLVDSAPFALNNEVNKLVDYVTLPAGANAGANVVNLSAIIKDSMTLTVTNYASRQTTFFPKIESLLGAAGDDSKQVKETVYPNEIIGAKSSIIRSTVVDPANRRPRVNDTIAYTLTARDEYGNPVYDKEISVSLSDTKVVNDITFSTLKSQGMVSSV